VSAVIDASIVADVFISTLHLPVDFKASLYQGLKVAKEECALAHALRRFFTLKRIKVLPALRAAH